MIGTFLPRRLHPMRRKLCLGKARFDDFDLDSRIEALIPQGLIRGFERMFRRVVIAKVRKRHSSPDRRIDHQNPLSVCPEMRHGSLCDRHSCEVIRFKLLADRFF